MSDTNLPGDDWEDAAGGTDDGVLNDPMLQRALAHAPDHAAEPEERLGASIRTLAHEAVAPSLPEGPVGAARPWWQRLLGVGGGASRMPWNAAFATVLVGVLVTVMWQREPVPSAEVDRPMQDRAVTQAPVPAPVPTPAPAAPAAPAPAPADAPAAAKPAPPNALDAALAESRAVTEASNRALDAQDRERERLAKETAAARAATAAAEQAADKALQKALAAEQAKEQAKAQAQRQAEGVAEASPPVPPLAASRRAAGMAMSPPPAAPSAPAAPAAPAAPVAEAVTPTFEALSQWTRLRITRSGGVSRSLPRDEARELGALVGSVALSGVGAQPFTGAVDWRISLERNGRVLAVLELAGAQASWREGSLPAATGRPGADSLAALRQALDEAAR